MASWQAPFAILVLVLLETSGCGVFDPDRQIETRISTRLVAPSPEIQRLLSVQRTQDTEVDRFWRGKHTGEEVVERVKELERNPETIYPGRNVFLSTMAGQYAETVGANVYLRLLENSEVKCSDPRYTTKFIKVRVTSGPLDGHTGWVCENDVFRTVAWP